MMMMLSACGLVSRCAGPEPIDQASFDALYATPAPPPEGALRVFHLGHSLVGPDMPDMLAQLAGAGHSYHSQLGAGTRMQAHWEPDVPIKAFEAANGHANYRDAHEAIASGSYDALVLTEGVEIKDAIKYGDSPKYLHEWARAAWAANPDMRVYFYESWHELSDPEGWLARLDRDLEMYWEGQILRPALAYEDIERPIYVIPAGQVMAAFVRKLEAQGGIGPIKSRTDLFHDEIHFNDYGAYLVALTHYAVLYGRSPVGLPHALAKPNGTPAEDPGPEAARIMQETVWEIVTAYPPSGVAQTAN